MSCCTECQRGRRGDLEQSTDVIVEVLNRDDVPCICGGGSASRYNADKQMFFDAARVVSFYLKIRTASTNLKGPGLRLTVNLLNSVIL